MGILIGTSGYSYGDWVGPVYPPGTPSRDFLGEFQKHFSFTEINSSYYRLPKPGLCASMAKRSHDDFRFSIKTHQSLTHERSNPSGPSLGQQVKAYLTGISPLAAAGKLTGILAQFPWSFRYETENRRYLASAAALFHKIASDILPGGTLGSPGSDFGIAGGCPLFVEFRNGDWIRPSVFSAMAEYSLFPVYQDCPDLPGLPGHLSDMIRRSTGHTQGGREADEMQGSDRQGTDRQATDRDADGRQADDQDRRPQKRGPAHAPASVGAEGDRDRRAQKRGAEGDRDPGPVYIRFHGRNRENWWTGTNVSRYDYLYAPQELEEFADELRPLAASSSTLLIAFNNHHRGQAVQNARSLQLLLDGSGADNT